MHDKSFHQALRTLYITVRYFPRPTLRTPVLLLELPLAFGAFLAVDLSSFFVVLFPKNLLDIMRCFCLNIRFYLNKKFDINMRLSTLLSKLLLLNIILLI